ncbi:hypothetical protein KI440_01485 [Candidatus Saccharibacteria bacterium TM7i]|nr:hypothetical protein KI440_01485 [Candidatus Saccharibacteria bacterium TM7i]
MRFFVKAEPALPARSDQSRQIAVLLAGVLTVFLVTQLFTFDEFIVLADTFKLPGFNGFGFAASIVVFELLSLPFLLRMVLSPAFRIMSALSLVVGMVLWLYATIIVVFARSVESLGITGGLGTLTPGWWSIFFVSALAVLAAWTLWGLWPARRKEAK